MQRRFKNILNNRLLQSLLFGTFITFVVSLVWDVPVERFEIKLSGDINKSTEQEKLWLFEDLDNDGNTDRLRCFNNSIGERFTIVSYNHQNRIVSTIHFRDDF